MGHDSMRGFRSLLALAVSSALAATVTGCDGSTSVAPVAAKNAANTDASVSERGGSVVSASPTPVPSPPNVWTGPGHVSGDDDMFVPHDGYTGKYNGQPIDGIGCAPTMSQVYHVHAFVGVYVNGVQYAIPDTVGMFKPNPHAINGFTASAQCYYDVHTHDASGIVHVESDDPLHVPITGSLFTTQQLFDEWGIKVDSGRFGPFKGPVQVYTSGQVYRGGPGNGVVYRSAYTLWTGDPNQVQIYSHEAIFFEVGPTYPPVLPNIIFYSEY